ncbi:hypothetical protein QFZ34_002077 [Phyllobacterium ifriqiyense]|uniref:Uncharacterized protein n=1 Tax=Phyllobacterium ifriqiyense TaxID=314238 RepID=A0ABU0SAE6_9HYPH|nr:hypothetical protein [Phyllobacterium ifriqiyense]MDQ0996895.1 hypothetical protein [Phyllobacterium ifriqiyense]
MNTERAASLCEEFNIQIVPANVAPKIGETRAPRTIERIAKRHGEARARFVLGTLADTANNRVCLDETVLWAVNDMVTAAEKNFPSIVTDNVEAWFQFFDSLPLGVLQYWCTDLEGVISKRHALGGMLYERMRRRFGDLAVQPDLLDDRRRTA